MFKKGQLKRIKAAVVDKPLVLLVDDEIQNLNVLEGVLKRYYEVIACTSGQAALDRLATMQGKEKIKVIISDQRMPNMTGVEFFHKVKHILPDALRIILTGYTDVSDIIDSINKANIYKFISKPFQPPDLLVTVMRACELFDINERLRISEGLKQEFINTVRHELRTPMNGIQGGVELLKIYLTEPINLEGIKQVNLSVIEESAKQMMQIVTSILDFSTFDPNEEITKKETRVVDVKTCLDAVIKPYFIEAEAKGLSVSMEGLEKNLWVDIDIEKLQEILGHILSNAIKFTSSGYVRVKISSELTTEDRRITIAVKDTGIGVDKNIQEKIFGMFVQGDGSFCRQYGGLGVGLAKTKKLVEFLEGKVWLESELGFGSQFFVELPVKKADKSDDKRNVKERQDYPAFENTPIVAVVEDNQINQLVLSKILESLKCKVRIFNNGKEFTDWAETNVVNMVFMDCQMPVMNGYDATKAIRMSGSLNKGTTIIACTANVSEEDKKICYKVGMNGFIGKPISIRSIRDILLQHIGFSCESGSIGGRGEQ